MADWRTVFPTLMDKKYLFIVLTPEEHSAEVERDKDRTKRRKIEYDEILRKSPKKTKFSFETEKSSSTELIEKYKNHFMTDDDIDLENEKDALDSRNSAILITHPSFSALMQATGGFRGGELTICGSYTFKGKPGGLTHFFKAFSFLTTNNNFSIFRN